MTTLLPRRTFPRTCWRIAALALLCGQPSGGRAAGLAPFIAGHQAIYDLSLSKSRRSPAIDAVNGRIAYAFAGDAATDTPRISARCRGSTPATARLATATCARLSWEGGRRQDAIASRSRRGPMKSTPSVVEGTAERSDAGVKVTLKRPARGRRSPSAPEVVFPTEQIRRIVAAAKEGKSLLQLVVYDGSDTGRKVYYDADGDRPGGPRRQAAGAWSDPATEQCADDDASRAGR